MRFENTYLPAGGYWSSPFCKWQGSFSSLHPVKFAAEVTVQGLAARGIAATELDSLVFGWTIPGRRIFYGAPWIAGLIGAPDITGAMISQACATSAAALAHAGAQVEAGGAEATVIITTDKCSNGAHIYYPDPSGPGGKGEAEDWVWDNFSFDPWAKNSMIQTAENVATEAGIGRETQDALAQHRYEQYVKGIESGFQKRYMLPYDVNPSGRKVIATVEGDEGVFPTTAEGLAKLRPVMPEGTITFGSQTHPADGSAGMVVGTKDRMKAYSGGDEPVQLLSYGVARVAKGYMAKAVVPAAQKALAAAGVAAKDCVIKTHNPFAVNDIYMARELGIEAESFNNNGSSLIFGHPQGPTGARLIAEGLEEARMNGGGYVLFAGCAAGDTAAAVVLKA
ncbi:MAG: thiolase family protein [Planctomycetota bacterium]|nr:thiolase family protein [Planctomycetota bacterium]